MPSSQNAPIAEEGELFATHIGGSATLEGVMMRGKLNWAVAIRSEHGIYVEEHDLPSSEDQPAWFRWPIIRGCVAFVQSMKLSLAAMDIASEHAWLESDGPRDAATAVEAHAVTGQTLTSSRPQPAGVSDTTATDASAGISFERNASAQTPIATKISGQDDHANAHEASTSVANVLPNAASDSSSANAATPNVEQEGLSPVEFIASVGLGLVLGVALFVALPVFLSNLIAGELTPQNALWWNIIEALVRIVILVAYVWLAGRVPDMARLFGYHGAEHLAIHCFEHGEELTPANCARYSRIHVRCGTAFLVMTIIVAIIVNSLVPVAALAESLGIAGIARNLFVFASRLVLLPLVAGVSYEVTVKWAGTHPESPLVKLALWPGLQMQKLTTNVPNEEMLVCAIEALKRVDAREKQLP